MTRVRSLVPVRLLRLAGLWALLTVFSASAAWAYWEGECEESGYFGEDEYYYGSETECWEGEEYTEVECKETLLGVRKDGSTERLYLSSTTDATITTTRTTSLISKVEGSCPAKACSGSLGGEQTVTETVARETVLGLYQTAGGYYVEVDCWDLSIVRQGTKLS